MSFLIDLRVKRPAYFLISSVYRFTGWPFQSSAHDFSVINYSGKPTATIIYDLSAGLITHVNWRKKLFIESFNGVSGEKNSIGKPMFSTEQILLCKHI